jgi:hypothetical protein
VGDSVDRNPIDFFRELVNSSTVNEKAWDTVVVTAINESYYETALDLRMRRVEEYDFEIINFSITDYKKKIFSRVKCCFYLDYLTNACHCSNKC